MMHVCMCVCLFDFMILANCVIFTICIDMSLASGSFFVIRLFALSIFPLGQSVRLPVCLSGYLSVCSFINNAMWIYSGYNNINKSAWQPHTPLPVELPLESFSLPVSGHISNCIKCPQLLSQRVCLSLSISHSVSSAVGSTMLLHLVWASSGRKLVYVAYVLGLTMKYSTAIAMPANACTAMIRLLRLPPASATIES